MIGTGVGIVATALIGLPIALRFRSRGPGLTLGLAFLLGSIAITVALQLLTVAGLHWSRAAAGMTALTLSALGFILLKKTNPPSSVSAPIRQCASDRVTGMILDLVFAGLVLTHLAWVTVAPLWEWDYIGIWGIKGAWFYTGAEIDWAFLENPDNSYLHPDYPLLVPLNFVWLSLIEGGWNDRALGALSTAFALSGALIGRGVAISLTGSRFVGGVVALALFRPLFDTPAGLADGPLGAFILAATVLLFLTDREDDPLPWVLAGGATLVKNEGLAFLAAFAAVAFFRGKARPGKVAAALAIAGTWLIPRVIHDLETDLITGPLLKRVGENVVELPGVLLSTSPAHPLIWGLAMIALLVAVDRIRPGGRATLLVLSLQAVFYLVAYAITPHDVGWHVETSWARLTLHILPSVVLIALLGLTGDIVRSSPRRAEAQPHHQP